MKSLSAETTIYTVIKDLSKLR